MARFPSQSAKFHEVYDTPVGPMREYCFRRLPASDVNDAVAEVFVAVWRKIDQLPIATERKLWMYGIARNVTRDAHRSSRRRLRLNSKVNSLSVEHDPGPEAVVVRHHEHEALLKALAELRPRIRKSFGSNLGGAVVCRDRRGHGSHGPSRRHPFEPRPSEAGSNWLLPTTSRRFTRSDGLRHIRCRQVGADDLQIALD